MPDPAETDRILRKALVFIGDAKDAVNQLDNSREKSLVITKLDEAKLWLRELGV